MVKNPPANARDSRNTVSIPVLGRSPGEINGNPLWYSCLDNSTDRGAWRAVDHGVIRSCTQLSNWAHTHYPLVDICLLSTSVTPFLFIDKFIFFKNFINFFYILHISDIIWYLSFSVWLTSLSMIISRSIHVASNGIISFLFYGSAIFHCIYVPRLHPFLCWWTLRGKQPKFLN